ncbi:MAG: TIM barrel protein [Pseudomonadota bacterium]
MKFSANLGFLWAGLALPDAIHAARAAGFAAVECHWPYDVPAKEVRQALRDTGLGMISLNTRRGDVAAGDMGLSALPGRGGAARAAIDEALDYAHEVGARAVHVMAGNASGKDAHASFLQALRYGCERAEPLGITLLIEPLNTRDAPGYFISTTGDAMAVIDDVAAPNLKLMFDCYHVALMEGDVEGRLQTLLPHIGHIQFAGVPDRGPPDQGELDYRRLFNLLTQLGYDRPIGAEYRPGGPTEASLGWMTSLP